jgi:hypothetical protein
MENQWQTINMCDFCTREIETCQAQPVWSREIQRDARSLDSNESVVACDRYESPVAMLQKRMHDFY